MAVGTFTTQKQSQREHESASMSVSQTCQKLAKVPVAFVFVGVSCFSKIVYNQDTAIFQQQPIVTDRPFVARANHSQQFRCKYQLEL